MRWLLIGGSALLATAAIAQTPDFAAALERLIETRSPEMKVDRVDQDRLVARRIDLVDGAGKIRLTLAAPAPNPIIDGVQYRRSFPASGITIYDADGNERGGFAVGDVPGGSALLAMDFRNADAIGWRVNPDGSVFMGLNQAPEVQRPPSLGGRVAPANATNRIALTVAGDGQPAIALKDVRDRPRLRLTVTPAGHGAIEFLGEDGEVIETFAPGRSASR